MKKVLSLILFLAVVSGVSGLILGGVNDLTADKIAQNSNLTLKTNVEKYFSADATYEDVSDGLTNDTVLAVYKVGDQGYAVECIGSGFGGDVKIFIAFDTNGTIIGLTDEESQETATVGEMNFTDETINNELYVGKTIDEQVGTRSGATYTSNAVLEMVDAAHVALKTLIK